MGKRGRGHEVANTLLSSLFNGEWQKLVPQDENQFSFSGGGMASMDFRIGKSLTREQIADLEKGLSPIIEKAIPGASLKISAYDGRDPWSTAAVNFPEGVTLFNVDNALKDTEAMTVNDATRKTHQIHEERAKQAYAHLQEKDQCTDRGIEHLMHCLEVCQKPLSFVAPGKTDEEVMSFLNETYKKTAISGARENLKFLQTSFEYDRDYKPEKEVLTFLKMADKGYSKKTRDPLERMRLQEVEKDEKLKFSLLDPEHTKTDAEMEAVYHKACAVYDARVQFMVIDCDHPALYTKGGDPVTVIKERIALIDEHLKAAGADYSALDQDQNKNDAQMRKYLTERTEQIKTGYIEDRMKSARGFLNVLRKNADAPYTEVADPSKTVEKMDEYLKKHDLTYANFDPEHKKTAEEMQFEVKKLCNIAAAKLAVTDLYSGNKEGAGPAAFQKIKTLLGEVGLDFTALDTTGEKHTSKEVEVELFKLAYPNIFNVDISKQLRR